MERKRVNVGVFTASFFVHVDSSLFQDLTFFVLFPLG